jgi:hypothetical protein
MTTRKKRPYRNIAVVFPNEKGTFYDQNPTWGVNTDLLDMAAKEDDLFISQEDFDRQYEDYKESTEVAEVLAPEANVFMYNCHAATNTGKDKKQT